MSFEDAPPSNLATCPGCGTKAEGEWTFCRACGRRLADPHTQAELQASEADQGDSVDAAAEAVTDRASVELEDAGVASTATDLTPGAALVPASDPQPTDVVAMPVAGQGGVVVDPTLTAPVPVAQQETRSPRRFPWRRVLFGTGLVTVLALIALLIANDVGTHSRLASTRKDLATTTASLKSTSGKLTKAQSDLMSLTSERDGLQTELSGVRTTLSDTQNQLSLKAGQLSQLKTCLDGVSIALSDVLNYDYSGAASALASVRTSCQAAQDAVGG